MLVINIPLKTINICMFRRVNLGSTCPEFRTWPSWHGSVPARVRVVQSAPLGVAPRSKLAQLGINSGAFICRHLHLKCNRNGVLYHLD